MAICGRLSPKEVSDLQRLPMPGHLVEHPCEPPLLQREAPLAAEPPTLHYLFLENTFY